MIDQFTTKITLPSDPEEIRQRLIAAIPDAIFAQALYPQIVQKAGQSRTPRGLCVLLLLSVSGLRHCKSELVADAAMNSVPDMIQALVDDPVAAKAALDYWDTTVLMRVSQLAEQSALEDYNLYVAARRVVESIFEYTTDKPGIYMVYQRPTYLLPLIPQVKTGLFLVFSFGVPCQLWTPWGEWYFGCNGNRQWVFHTLAILNRFEAVLHKPDEGIYGPVFGLHRVDDTILPPPTLVRELEEYISEDSAGEAWGNMTARYEAEHGK